MPSRTHTPPILAPVNNFYFNLVVFVAFVQKIKTIYLSLEILLLDISILQESCESCYSPATLTH